MSMSEELNERRKLSRREFLELGAAGTGLLLLAGCGGGQGGGSGTLNALFMSQAAYSETDVKNMTEQFQKQDPGIKVNLTFVTYEALHDKIVAAAPAGTYDTVLVDVIWAAEFASKKMLGEAGVNPPPDTWDGVVEAARALKSKGVVEYPLIWSWAQAEAII